MSPFFFSLPPMQIAMQWSWLHSNKAGNNKEDARCVALAERKRMPSLHKAIQSCHPLPLSGCCTRLVAQASASSPHLIREREEEKKAKAPSAEKQRFFFLSSRRKPSNQPLLLARSPKPRGKPASSSSSPLAAPNRHKNSAEIRAGG